MYVCFIKAQALKKKLKQQQQKNKTKKPSNKQTNKKKNRALLCVIRHDCVTDSSLVSVPSSFFQMQVLGLI